MSIFTQSLVVDNVLRDDCSYDLNVENLKVDHC